MRGIKPKLSWHILISMKTFYFITTLLTLFLIGCSSIYKVNDFPSRDEFYADFNKTAYDHTVKVTLNNDSSFIITEDVTVLNDTLLFSTKKPNVNFEKLPTNQIKKLSFNSHLGGIKYGFISCAVPGLFLGLAISLTTETNSGENTNYIYSVPLISGAVGGIIGYIFGHNYIYQFNP